MNQPIEAMNLAFQKFPELEPYRVQLRKLCFKDVAGIDVFADFKHAEVPWTFILMKMLIDSKAVPEGIAIRVPSFIIEVHENLNAGRDYSQSFADMSEVQYVGKAMNDKQNCQWPSYWFVIKNKAGAIRIDDWKDHIFAYVYGYTNLPENLSDEEWTKQSKIECQSWEWDGNGGSRSGNARDKIYCRGGIENDLKSTRTTIEKILPTLDDNIQLRKLAVRYVEVPKNINLYPEVV